MIERPEFPKYKKAEGSNWWMWLVVLLIYAVLATVFGWNEVNPAPLTTHQPMVHSTYPDPRIEWVELDAAGLVVSDPSDSTHVTRPLPMGSYLTIPIVVNGPFPPSHKEA